MRRSSLLLPVVFLTLALVAPPSGGAWAKGDLTGYYAKFTHAKSPEKTPDVAFYDAGGKKRTLKDFRGKVVLLNFWTTWCPACIVEMPLLNTLQAKLGGANFTVLTLSQDGSVAVVKRFLKRRKLANLPVLMDKNRKMGIAFKQTLLPTTMLLDTKGRELGRIVGAVDWDSPEAVSFIKRYLPGGGT